MDTRRKVFIWIASLIGVTGICIFVYYMITAENKYPPIAALIPFSLAFIVALNTLLGAAHKNEKNVKPNEQVYYRYISDSTYRKINIIGVIATIIGVAFAIIGGGGILGWYQMLKPSFPQEVVKTPVSEEEDSGVTSTPPIRNAIEKPETNNREGPTPKKEKFVATGESGYKLNERFALEAAEEDAVNKLSRRLIINKSDISYEIDRDTVYFVDGEGYKAKIVIYTYK